MPRVVQIITIGDAADAAIAVAREQGLLEDADFTPAFVQATVEEDQLRSLLELGLKVSVVAQRAAASPPRAASSSVAELGSRWAGRSAAEGRSTSRWNSWE